MDIHPNKTLRLINLLIADMPAVPSEVKPRFSTLEGFQVFRSSMKRENLGSLETRNWRDSTQAFNVERDSDSVSIFCFILPKRDIVGNSI